MADFTTWAQCIVCYLGSSSPTEATSWGSGSHDVHAWLQQPINEFNQQPINEFQMDSLTGL